eukprot:787272_1
MTFSLQDIEKFLPPIIPYEESEIKSEEPTNTPFVDHMSTEEANKLVINDKIDHRDTFGGSTSAIIVDKKQTNLKIHYPEYGKKFDVWSNYKNELYKFAKHESISSRPGHNFMDLQIDEFINVNPLNHPGWKLGKMDGFEVGRKSGQIKIIYNINGCDYEWWTHVDNKNEVKQLSNQQKKSII